MAEGPTGFSERSYQHHYVQTQSENNGPIPDQQTEHQDAEEILKACSSFSDIQDDDGGEGQRTESNPRSWSVANKCDRDSCQLNGQCSLYDNLRAEANSNTCHDPENNLTPGAENPDETQPKSNHYTQNHDTIENICPGNINDIGRNGQTPNIPVPVQPNNNEGDKLVINCSHETLEYLNDNLLSPYNSNWKSIASIHKWDYQKIVQFERKYENKEFKTLVLQKEFCTYTVNNLLADLKQIQRQDILNDYPSKWS